MRLSKHLEKIEQSPIVTMNMLAKKQQKEGVNVINFSIGVPNFLPPKHVYAAAADALQNDSGQYLNSRGSEELLSAFIGRLKKDGFTYTENEVCCAVGAKNALNNLFIALLDVEDEVIYPAPYWSSYKDNITLYGGINKPIYCSAEQNYKLTAQQLENAFTEKTKIFLFNNPTNPTGMVYTEAEIKALGDVLEKHPDVWIISDDIYDKMIFDDLKFHHLLHTNPQLKDRTVIVQSVSKTYGMPGWRVGMMAGPKELIDQMVVIAVNTFMNIPAETQAGAAAAFSGDHTFVEKARQTFEKKRNLVMEMITTMPLITCPRPQGAFYVFPNIEKAFGRTFKGKTIATDVDFCTTLLAEYGIACVPGSAFGDPNAIRLSYSMDEPELIEGLERLKNFLLTLDEH